MKNLLVIALMTLLSTATFANAENPIKDNSQMTVEAEETKTAVILKLTNLAEQPTTVYLEDDNSTTVFSKKMKATSDIALRLDLSQVKSGDYVLRVKRNQKSFVQDITVRRDGSVVVGEMTTWVKPTLRQETGKFVVSNPNASVKSVKMYDKEGNLVYHKKYGKREKAAANVAFNLAQVSKGTYTVIVSTFNEAYDFEVEVQ
jgi:hypothetical protein